MTSENSFLPASDTSAEKITLFAPFESGKNSKNVSPRSSEFQKDKGGGKSSTNNLEVEFRESQNQSPKVFFRKIKLAVSGSTTSTSSHSSSHAPGPPKLGGGMTSQAFKSDYSSGVKVGSIPSINMSSSERKHSSSGHVSVNANRDNGNFPQISLTSYSDAHSRLAKKKSSQLGAGQQSQGVNKTEMLKRFGRIAESRTQDNNDDFKKYWMPDKSSKECSNCSVKFGVFIRRHHCRICGRIFCHACCNTTIPGNLLRPDLQGNLRVCKDCCEIFTEFRLSKMSKSQPGDPVKPDHPPSPLHPSVKQLGMESPQSLQSSGSFNRSHPHSGTRTTNMNILSPHKSWDEASLGMSQEITDISPSRNNIAEFDGHAPSSRRRLSGRKPTNFDTISAKQQQETIMILDENEVGVMTNAIWPKFLDSGSGCSRTNRRYRLRNFPDSYTGSIIVNWLVNNGHVSSRLAGMQVAQALVDTKRLKIISSNDSEFKDETNQFLELGEAATLPVDSSKSLMVKDAPKWFQHLPQESDLDYELSRGASKELYSSAQETFPSKPLYGHAPSFTSFVKLTSSYESNKDAIKVSEDDYLIVEELMSKSDDHDSSMIVSPHSTPSPLPTCHSPSPSCQLSAESVHPAGAGGEGREGKERRRLGVGDEELTLQNGSSPTLKVKFSKEDISDSSPSKFKLEINEKDRDIQDLSAIKKPTSTSSIIPQSKTEAEAIFRREHEKHFRAVMTQIIKSYGLSLSWLDIIQPLIVSATQTVRTDVFTDDVMDINEYVRVKKIPCGLRSDSSLNYGAVCTKNVTHKKMNTEILNPSILLLKCAFDFQRRENQLSSFDTLHLQENKYLQNLVDKVKAFKPDIILVQKSVSRLALEDLYDIGIVVVVNVKPSVMARVSRCTNGEILTSLDQLFFNVHLGTCGKFYVRNFTLDSGVKKTLMYFDHCEEKLGCVITLQGSSSRELKKVKKVTQFGLHISYNSMLESSFLLDEFARLNSSNEERVIIDSLGSYHSTPLTPEFSLYPSIAHPLDSLPPSKVIQRLMELGLCNDETVKPPHLEVWGPDEISIISQSGEEEGEDSIPVFNEDKEEDKDVIILQETAKLMSNSESKTCLTRISNDVSEKKNENDNLTKSLTHVDSHAFVPQVDSHTSVPQVDSHTSVPRVDSHASVPQVDDSHTSTPQVDPHASVPQVDSHTFIPQVDSKSEQVDSQTTFVQADSQITVESPDTNPDLLKLQAVDRDVLINLSAKEFEMVMKKQLLSISPNVKFPVPYLQTAQGNEADIRQYLPSVIYWSFQFKPNVPSSNLLWKPQERDEGGDALEKGITKTLVEETTLSQKCTHSGSGMSHQISYYKPSYKSVSEHPLTSSFLLLKANTNEMKAALADFRSRAGLQTEDNSFFFHSAKVAADYRLHLQNLFNKYKQFEDELEEDDDEAEDIKEEGNGGKRKKRKKKHWWKGKSKDTQAGTPPITDALSPPKPNPGNVGVVPDGSDVTTTTPSVIYSQNSTDSMIREAAKESSMNSSQSSSSQPLPKETAKESSMNGSQSSSSQPLPKGTAKESSMNSSLSSPSQPRPKDVRTASSDSAGSEFGTKFRTRNLEDMDKGVKNEMDDIDECRDIELSYNEMWLNSDQHMDCFDPINHQGISVLFSSTCHDGQKHQRPCLPPCIIPMFYYGHNDIAIGDFLQRYCFREFYRCQTCTVDMAKHIRHIIHGPNAIHITVQSADSNLSGKDNSIYTWLSCLKCHQATPYTPMSRNSLLFSFAKFLELKFYCDAYVSRFHGDKDVSCTHSLHNDFVQCFMYRNKLASFRPSSIEILEVLLPPRTIHITTPSNKYHHDYSTDIKHAGRIVEGVFYRIRQKLDRYRLEPVAGLINDHISNSKAERGAMRTKVKHIKELIVSGGFIDTKFKVTPSVHQTNVTDSEKDYKQENIDNVQDELEDLKRAITEVVECWNIILEELDVRVREYRRRLREMGEVILADGFTSRSQRESPVAVISTVIENTDHTAAEDNTSTLDIPPIDTPTGQSEDIDHTPNSSPEMIVLCDVVEISPNKDKPILSSTDAVNHLALPTKIPSSTFTQKKSLHGRNLSDGGIVTLASKEPQHKRNLSDSQAVKGREDHIPFHMEVEIAMPAEVHLKKDEVNISTLCLPDSALSSGGTPSRSTSSASKENMGYGYSEIPSSPVVCQHAETEEEQKENEQDNKIIDQPSNIARSEGHVDGESHTDNPGGFLAKFRDIHIGKEQDGRDDPTKFYLLDPYLITTSSPNPKQLTHVSGSTGGGNGTETGVKSGTKRYVGALKKVGSTTSVSNSEVHSEAKGEKRNVKDKDRYSVISRPYQKLPPPFEYHEHHKMQGHTTVPVAIYEKEPTSIIAYALSSREYAAELKVLTDKTLAKHLPSVVGLGGVAEVKAPVASPGVKRNLMETEKTPPSSSTSKSFFSELKKKSSAINIFSGLSSSSNTTVPPSASDTADPFERSVEGNQRKMESTTSSSGQSTRSGDGGSEGLSFMAPSTVVGLEELEQGKSSRGHISLEFSNPEKTANFFCKVYYAEEFRQLRECIFPSGEDRYMRSLTRCVKYEAKGGKSRSAFCKVADDRFILKQIKSIEISVFEDFAPRYLEYVTKALEEKRPLALAKIFGAYSIGFKNSRTGHSKRMDVVVMENLLYGHNISRVFDLKGSMRSRYIDPSKDSSGDVLLDENYLNTICHDPVYIHPHSKFVLMQSILADSEFLAQNSIMDYSLLTCIDESTGMLVVGIIDYVRTFTFDKRLEMYLKKTASRELPTVVYPELYRKRFCEAMERYFTMVPDKWSGLGVDF